MDGRSGCCHIKTDGFGFSCGSHRTGARHLDRSFSIEGIKRPKRSSIKDEVKDAQDRAWTLNGD